MKQFMILALACAVTLGIGTTAFAEDPPVKVESGKIVSQSQVKGEILKIDGDNYLLNDERSKKEVKFTIEKDVRATLDRPLKPGDRIEAFLTPEGYAKMVRLESAKDTDMKNQGGMKSPEGSNPSLSPEGKGSASGG